MKINGNIVSCAGNFALRARCKVARGTSHFVLVASGAGNFARCTAHTVSCLRMKWKTQYRLIMMKLSITH